MVGAAVILRIHCLLSLSRLEQAERLPKLELRILRLKNWWSQARAAQIVEEQQASCFNLNFSYNLAFLLGPPHLQTVSSLLHVLFAYSEFNKGICYDEGRSPLVAQQLPTHSTVDIQPSSKKQLSMYPTVRCSPVPFLSRGFRFRLKSGIETLTMGHTYRAKQ